MRCVRTSDMNYRQMNQAWPGYKQTSTHAFSGSLHIDLWHMHHGLRMCILECERRSLRCAIPSTCIYLLTGAIVGSSHIFLGVHTLGFFLMTLSLNNGAGCRSTKIRQKSRQAISFWSMQPDSGHAISSKFEERSCIWRSRARLRIFALTASMESVS